MPLRTWHALRCRAALTPTFRVRLGKPTVSQSQNSRLVDFHPRSSFKTCLFWRVAFREEKKKGDKAGFVVGLFFVLY